MTIKEQIEIARLIASGTPREVAISEAKVTSSMYQDELPPAKKQKQDLQLQKQDKMNLINQKQVLFVA